MKIPCRSALAANWAADPEQGPAGLRGDPWGDPWGDRQGEVGEDAAVDRADEPESLGCFAEGRGAREAASAFWTRANTYFNCCGIMVVRVLTDNGSPYRSIRFAQTSAQHARTDPALPVPEPTARSNDDPDRAARPTRAADVSHRPRGGLGDATVGHGGGPDGAQSDGLAGARGVPHHAVAGINAVVVRGGTEEHQVARLRV